MKPKNSSTDIRKDINKALQEEQIRSDIDKALAAEQQSKEHAEPNRAAMQIKAEVDSMFASPNKNDREGSTDTIGVLQQFGAIPHALGVISGNDTLKNWEWSKNRAEDYMNIYDEANARQGTTAEQNYKDTAARIVPSLVGGFGIGAIVRGATKGITKAALKSGVKGAALSGAAELGINEAIEEGLVEPSEGGVNDYDSISDSLFGESDDPEEAALIRDVLSKIDADKVKGDDGITAGDVATGVGGVGAAALLLTGRGRRAIKDIVKPEKKSVLPEEDQLVRSAQNDSVTTVSDRAETALFRREAAAENVMKREAAPELAREFEAQNAARANPVAVSQMSQDALRTGHLPMPIGRGEQAPIILSDKVRKLPQTMGVNPEATEKAGSVLLAMSEIDNISLRAVSDSKKLKSIDDALINAKPKKREKLLAEREDLLANGERSIRFGDKNLDRAGLENIIKKYNNDPAVREIVEATQEFHRKILDFKVQHGLVSLDAAEKLKKRHPNYIPNQIATAERGWKEKLFSTSANNRSDYTDSTITQLGSRNIDIDVAGTFKNPAPLVMQDLISTIRDAQVNSARKMFFNALTDDKGESLVKGIKRTTKSMNDADDVVTYLDNGRKVSYKIPNDPTLRTSLLYQPALAPKILEGPRKLMQFATTGWGRPVFSVVSALFESSMAPFLRKEGANLGYLTKVFGESNLLSALDPTAWTSGIFGFGRGLYGNMLGEASEYFADQLIRSDWGKKMTGVAGLMGRQRVEAAAKKMGEVYAKTTVQMFNSGGMGGGRGMDNLLFLNKFDPINGALEMDVDLKRLARMDWRSSMPARTLYAFYNSIHTATKYQYLALNKGRLSAKELDKRVAGKTLAEAQLEAQHELAMLVREISSDFTRKGAATGTQLAVSASPYANVMLQTTHQVFKEMKRDPKKFATVFAPVALAAAAMVHRNSTSSPAMHDFYWNQLSEFDRANNFVWGDPDNPEQSILIPKDPFFRPLITIVEGFFDAIAGSSQGDMDPQLASGLDSFFALDTASGVTPFEMKQKEMASALQSSFGVGLPPMAGAGLAVFGIQPPMSPFQNMREIRGQRIENYDGSNKKYVGGLVSEEAAAVYDAVLGASGPAFVDLAETVHMALENKPGDYANAFSESMEVIKKHQLEKAAPMLFRDRIKPHNAGAGFEKSYEYKDAITKVKNRVNTLDRNGMTNQSDGVALKGAAPDPYRDEMDRLVSTVIKEEFGDVTKQYFSDPENGINTLKLQMDSVMSDSNRSFREREAAEYELRSQVRHQNAEYIAALHDTEERVAEYLSEQLGRPIEFDLLEFVENDFKL